MGDARRAGPEAFGVGRIALADVDCRCPGLGGVDRGSRPRRARGAGAAGGRGRSGPRPERPRRLRRSRPDGGDAGGGDRPRPREQGVAGRRRGARYRPRRSHERPHRPGGLRAHSPAPADLRPAPGGGRAAHDHRQRRPVPWAHPCGARGRDRQAGARPSHLGDGGQDHDRLRHADEQGAGVDGGPPPVRRAL